VSLTTSIQETLSSSLPLVCSNNNRLLFDFFVSSMPDLIFNHLYRHVFIKFDFFLGLLFPGESLLTIFENLKLGSPNGLNASYG
jgi:hypothetical protein